MAADIVHSNPKTITAPGGHYSHAVSANGFVFVSGQLPIASDGSKLNDAPFERQAQQVLDNVAAAWAGAARPARAVVPVPALHYGFKIEIEAVALAGTA